jgi:hypothetical protein
MHKGATEAKASYNLNGGKTTRFSTKNTKEPASKASRHQRSVKTTYLRNSMKARDTVMGRAGTRTKTKGSEGSTISFMERTKGTSLGIARMPRKLRKG